MRNRVNSTRTPTRERITDAALVLQQRGFSDVVKWMLARDKKQSHKPRSRRRTRVHVADRYGNKARGGEGYVNKELLDEALKSERSRSETGA